MSIKSTNVSETPWGFDWGPMRVERAACGDDIGWVIVVRPVDRDYPRVEVRCSPTGRSWQVRDMGEYGYYAFRPVGQTPPQEPSSNLIPPMARGGIRL